jgi:hypothetical protein
MGKDLHYTILPYLEKALQNHTMVQSLKKEETDEHIFYNIKRVSKSDLRIWVSDAYRFNIHDYIQRPHNINFIYLAKPESDYDQDGVVRMAFNDGINIGKFSALMGILYKDDIKRYIPKERRD